MRRIARGVVCAAIAVATIAATEPGQWFGMWKLRLRSADEKPETLVYSDAGGGAMRMVSVEENSVIVTRFDGRPAPDVGKARGRGNSLAVKATSPTSYAWTFRLAGKPYVRGVNTLADDRRSFTEVAWMVANPKKRFTLIYDRQ